MYGGFGGASLTRALGVLVARVWHVNGSFGGASLAGELGVLVARVWQVYWEF